MLFRSATFTKEISLKDLGLLSSDQEQELEMIFNIYLRKVMEARKYFALKNNRYFNLGQANSVPNTNLNAVTGYFLSISAIKEGLYLTIDTSTEFFRKKSCLEEIKDLMAHGYKQLDIPKFFRGRRVSIFCAKGKTLRICAVNFKLNPRNCMVEPEKKSLITVWEEKYKIKVKDLTQPIFKAKKKGEEVYLIPEFCYITGIEEESKKHGKGISELGLIGAEPNEKDKIITGMFKSLGEGQMLEQYGLIMSDIQNIPFQILPAPQIKISGGEKVSPQELLRGVRIMNPIDFKNWMFIYEAKNYDNADKLYNTMLKSSASLGIKISEPEWGEIEYINKENLNYVLKSQKN